MLRTKIELLKYCQRIVFGRDSIFDIEKKGLSEKEIHNLGSEQISPEECQLYGEMYGKMMTLLETSLEGEKLKAAKSLARQLFQTSKFKMEEIMHNAINDFLIKEDLEDEKIR